MPQMVSNRTAWIFLAIFAVVRFGFDSLWREVSPYYSFAFEGAFVFAVCARYWNRIRWSFFPFGSSFISLGLALSSLGAGFAVFRLAPTFGTQIPFVLNSTETLIHLLLIAPILEELVFRLALWEPLKDILRTKHRVIWASALLFSLSHLLAILYVPEQFVSFVLYQSAYVVLLGLLAGWLKWVTESTFPAIIVHFLFNLGFYLAS